MRKSQLSDKQLEEILGQMPKIKDHRDSRDIYQNIAHRIEKRKMPGWVIPGAALAAVLFLTFILSSGLMGGNYSQEKSMDSSASGEKSSMEMKTAIREDDGKENTAKQENALKMDTADSKAKDVKEDRALVNGNSYDGLISLYPDEVEHDNSEVFTYAVPDEQAMALVPVTVTVPKEEGKSWIDGYMDTMAKLQEKEWGLTEYYPVDATWTYNDQTKTLSMDVKQDHPYKDGSTAETNFKESMTQNFSGVGIERLLLTTEGKPGIEFGNTGLVKSFKITAEPVSRRAYLFLTMEGRENPYLVPTKDHYESIGQAFAQMWKGNGYLSASLPDDFKLENTKNNNEVLEITLGGNTTLDEAFLPNLEAILMTASEFDYSGVKFVNANIDHLGPFNLKEVLPLPLAPNKQNIE